MVVKTHKKSMRSKRNSSSKKSKSHSGKKTMKNRKVMRGGYGRSARPISTAGHFAKQRAKQQRVKELVNNQRRRPVYIPAPPKVYIPAPPKLKFHL